MRAIGEKVVSRSPVSAGVRHFELSCGGPMTPPVSVRVMIRHSPGSMPPAYAAVAMSVSMAAVSATLMESIPALTIR